MEGAVDRVDGQAVGLDGGEVRASGNDGDVRAAFVQPSGQMAAMQTRSAR